MLLRYSICVATFYTIKGHDHSSFKLLWLWKLVFVIAKELGRIVLSEMTSIINPFPTWRENEFLPYSYHQAGDIFEVPFHSSVWRSGLRLLLLLHSVVASEVVKPAWATVGCEAPRRAKNVHREQWVTDLLTEPPRYSRGGKLSLWRPGE